MFWLSIKQLAMGQLENTGGHWQTLGECGKDHFGKLINLLFSLCPLTCPAQPLSVSSKVAPGYKCTDILDF